MIAMSGKPSKKKKKNYWGVVVNLRTHPAAKDALTMAKAKLAPSATLRFRGKKPTEEAIFAALCLWAASEDVGRLEELLAPHMARLETLVGKDDGDGDGGAQKKPPELPRGEVGGITSTTINRGGRKGRLPRLRIDPEGDGQAI